MRALEEPHRVELNLTSNLATAYANYKNNLAALEAYRKNILPDQVRAVRGIEQRRRFDIQALSLTDLATVQQNLATSVTSYLTLLGQLWTSTVTVADLLQTDDLFQLAEPASCRRCPTWISCRRCRAAIPVPRRKESGVRNQLSAISYQLSAIHIVLTRRLWRLAARRSFPCGRRPTRLLPRQVTNLPHQNRRRGDDRPGSDPISYFGLRDNEAEEPVMARMACLLATMAVLAGTPFAPSVCARSRCLPSNSHGVGRVGL